jgi:small GTP-binding protein
MARQSYKTIRIGVLGNVDSGKSTLVGVLTKLQNGEFDDGRGFARSKIFIHQHELESGRTSAITKESIKKDNNVLEFVDLAGHEKYFRTTIRGICNNCIDYVLLLINGNMGNLTKMTLEHLYLVLSLKIPLIVIITKIDIAPSDILDNTIHNIKTILKKNKFFSHVIKDYNDLSQSIFENYFAGEEGYIRKFVPIIKISNKTGYNIDMLKNILFRLNNVFNFDIANNNKKFIVNNVYTVDHIGMILSGICYQGSIKKGDILHIILYNNILKLQVKSLHDDFQTPIDELFLGETGCLAVKALDKYYHNNLKKRHIRNGSIIMEHPETKYDFLANIMISNSSITIKEQYQPVINSMSINQVAILEKICDVNNDEKNIIRCHERALVRFKFKHHPEFINKDQYFIFRDGKIKGIGKILE